MSTTLQHYDAPGVSLHRKPSEVLAEAQEAAQALMTVIKLKNKPVIFNNEQYIEREDWGVLAKFFGCTAKVTETRPVTFGNASGFEAVAVCLDRQGNEISRAESMCLDDEKNWGAVPKYEWKDILDENGKRIWDQKLRNGKGGYKAEKIEAGTESKPLFQLRSMAQTRAEAKVLKSVFGYVVVMAGFKASVAEEMTGNEQPDEQQQKAKQAPEPPPITRKSEKKGNDTPIETKPGCITEGQIKLLFVIQKQTQISEPVLKAIIKQIAGVEHRNEIPSGKFEELLKALDPENKFHKPRNDGPPPEAD